MKMRKMMNQSLSVSSAGGAGQGDRVPAPFPSQAANDFPSAISRCPGQVQVADLPQPCLDLVEAKAAGSKPPSSSQGLFQLPGLSAGSPLWALDSFAPVLPGKKPHTEN